MTKEEMVRHLRIKEAQFDILYNYEVRVHGTDSKQAKAALSKWVTFYDLLCEMGIEPISCVYFSDYPEIVQFAEHNCDGI